MGKKICSCLATVLLVILLAVAVILIIPRFFGIKQFAVLSGSMEPDIKVGSLVFDKEVGNTEIKKGDVITFKLSDKTFVTHRVDSINSDGSYVTKGDANKNVDGKVVTKKEVVGIYKFNIPYLGYVTLYGRTPLGVAAVCGILIVIILLNFLPDALTSVEENEENLNTEDDE